MEPQLLLNVLIAVAGFCVAWWVRTIQSAQIKQQDQMVELMRQISSLNVELAKNYAPRAELEKTFERIFNLLEEIRKEVRHAQP